MPRHSPGWGVALAEVKMMGWPAVPSAMRVPSTNRAAPGGSPEAVPQQRWWLLGADALLGRSDVTGRLPVALPPWFPLGAGLSRQALGGAR